MDCRKVCTDYLDFDGYLIPINVESPLTDQPNKERSEETNMGVPTDRSQDNEDMGPYLTIGVTTVVILGILGALSYN